MRKLIYLMLGLTMFFVISGCKRTDNGKPPEEEDNEERIVQLIDDASFANGFNVLGYSPVEHGRNIEMVIDYDGATDAEPSWYMAQWWTPYNLNEALYEFNEGVHEYKTQSRTISINPEDDGYLLIELLGSEEFFGGTRESLNDPWPHALIEQNFTNKVKVDELEAININLEVSVNNVVDKNKDQYNPNMHAAQLLWYFTLSNNVPENADYEEVGQNKDYLWFGVPIYDNRYDFIGQSAHIDEGFAGNTNKLIYSMGSNHYFKEPIEFGKTYTVNIDILPYIKEAFIYAITNGALINCQFENMEIDYMNFGWELPGAFDVSSTIKNLSVEAIRK